MTGRWGGRQGPTPIPGLRAKERAEGLAVLGTGLGATIQKDLKALGEFYKGRKPKRPAEKPTPIKRPGGT
jgi:hypothetical protein